MIARCMTLSAITLLAPVAASADSPTVVSAVQSLGFPLAIHDRSSSDIDGDGDIDELVNVENEVGYDHCVLVFRTTSGYRRIPITGPGGDYKSRCIGVVGNMVVVATSGDEDGWHSFTTRVHAWRVNEQGYSRLASARLPDRATTMSWTLLTATPAHGGIDVRAPGGFSLQLRPRGRRRFFTWQ
jgi:hypothetical protein